MYVTVLNSKINSKNVMLLIPALPLNKSAALKKAGLHSHESSFFIVTNVFEMCFEQVMQRTYCYIKQRCNETNLMCIGSD